MHIDEKQVFFKSTCKSLHSIWGLGRVKIKYTTFFYFQEWKESTEHCLLYVLYSTHLCMAVQSRSCESVVTFIFCWKENTLVWLRTGPMSCSSNKQISKLRKSMKEITCRHCPVDVLSHILINMACCVYGLFLRAVLSISHISISSYFCICLGADCVVIQTTDHTS